MPQIEDGRTIEKLYWELIRKMTPAERFARASRLINEVKLMAVYQIRKKTPEIDERSLQFALARRMYWDDPKALALLNDAERKEKANG